MKIHIDFQIYDSNDPKRIIVLDTSLWGPIEDKMAIIEVIPPGDDEAVVFPYTKRGITILNSYNLGLNCEDCGEVFNDLDDGVYQITVKASPDKFNRTRLYLKTTTLHNDLDALLIKAYSVCHNCEENDNEISRIMRYYDLIAVAEAFIRKGHRCEAQDIIFKIQDFLKHKNCKRCPHKV